MNAILETRRAQRRTAPIASSPAGCCRARFSAASSTPARAPTIPTISCRTSTGASCERCASSARGRTSPTSRPRTRSTRWSRRTARRIVKHYLQDVGSTFGMCNDLHEWDLSYEYFYEGAPVAKRFFTLGFGAEPLADRRLRRVPVGRQVRRQGVRSQEVAAADADGRLHGAARRRRVLGGAARGGIHRRHDQGGRRTPDSSAMPRPRSTSPTC